MVYEKEINVLTNKQGSAGEQGVRGSLEFSGTEINAISDITEATYTITTASTGITSATMPILVGDTYINVTTQDVWICSTAGTPTTSKWKYQGRRCSDKDDTNRFRMFTPATDNGTMQSTLTKSVVKGENPFGKIDDLLKITNTNGTEASNYTPYNKRIKIDPKKTYRYVAYIKQEDSNYMDYFGVQSYRTYDRYIGDLSTGTELNYAYFVNSANFGTLGRWYMIVGYVVANGTTTAPDDSGVYDMVTKQKVRTVTNFQWLSTATAILQMGTLIRYTASASTKTGTVYLYDVRLDEINGSEPTLNELLNLDTTTKSKGAWTASTVYNTGDIVYLNGNSYICTANHTSGTSFSTTNWNLIASKGADGKNAITMTSATTPVGEYNGQIGIWRGQVYSWNGTDWILTSGILPTDPVLHYSFDDLPELPDGVNYVYKKNKDFTTTENFSHYAIVENSCLVINFSKWGQYSYKTINYSNQQFYISLYSYYTGTLTLTGRKTGLTYDTELQTINVKKGEKAYFICYAEGDYTNFNFYIRPGNIEVNKIIIESIYIGDASYTTPIIDNSGNNFNSTDVKGLATKGVSGNSYRTLQNGYIVAKSPLNWNSQYEYSFSTWIKRYESSVYIANNWDRYQVSTLFLTIHNYVDNNSLSRVDVYTQEGKVNRYLAELSLPPIGEWFHYVATIKDGVAVVYINGVNQNFKLDYYTDGFHKNTPELLQIGRMYNETGYSTKEAEFDDFQIFDRALSDQEVLGLYLARGNTPKQYTMADYQLDNSSGKYYGYEKPAVPFKNDTYLDTITGYLYEYDGVKWVAITDVSDPRYNQAINDMIAFVTENPDLPFITARNAWIERLAVDSLLANKIATQEILLRDNGVIKSSNYVEGESGFKIASDGTAEFYSGRFRGGLGTIKLLSTTNDIRLKVAGLFRLTIFKRVVSVSENEVGRPIASLVISSREEIDSVSGLVEKRITTVTGQFYEYANISKITEGFWTFPEIHFESVSYDYELWGCFEQIGPEE